MTKPAAALAAAPGHTARVPVLRSVGLPSEHGGWGLTMEPVLLGLLVAPSAAGGCLGAAALVAFLLRTPAKLALVDRRRGRWLERSRVAARLTFVEAALLLGLIAAAFILTEHSFWTPAAAAAPLFVLAFTYEIRSRGRRLAPELAGAMGVSAVAPMIVLAAGEPPSVAAGLGLVLTARMVTSIPYVRAQVARIHGRVEPVMVGAIADGSALGLAVIATGLHRGLLAGALAVVMIVVVQRVIALAPPPRAVVVGVRQVALGFVVVIVTALGVLGATS